jgi:DNA invertase Pin-like site-specific DNA recombinase
MPRSSNNISNKTRAGWAEAALAGYRGAKGERSADFTSEESVIDLLTDLRHYCKQQGISFRSAVNMSEIHFNEEGGK